MKLKRTLAVFAAIVMMSMTACGESEKSSNNSSSGDKSSTGSADSSAVTTTVSETTKESETTTETTTEPTTQSSESSEAFSTDNELKTLNDAIGSHLEQFGKNNTDIDKLGSIVVKTFGITSQRKDDSSSNGIFTRKNYTWEMDKTINGIRFTKITVGLLDGLTGTYENTLAFITLETDIPGNDIDEKREEIKTYFEKCGFGAGRSITSQRAGVRYAFDFRNSKMGYAEIGESTDSKTLKITFEIS